MSNRRICDDCGQTFTLPKGFSGTTTEHTCSACLTKQHDRFVREVLKTHTTLGAALAAAGLEEAIADGPSSYQAYGAGDTLPAACIVESSRGFQVHWY